MHIEKLLHGRDFQLHNAEPELCRAIWLPVSMGELRNTPLSCSSCEKRILLFQEMALILETCPVTQKSIISTLSPGILSEMVKCVIALHVNYRCNAPKESHTHRSWVAAVEKNKINLFFNFYEMIAKPPYDNRQTLEGLDGR